MPSLDEIREASEFAVCIKLMWQKMRPDIIGRFPEPVPLNDIEAYLSQIDDIYETDACHSLSIEGYQVNPELINQVRAGNGNPDQLEADKQHRDAMAARDYWQAFQEVRKAVQNGLEGGNAGQIADQNYGIWYRELFAPSVAVGILKPSDLAGYRSAPVYIRKSMHVPPSPEPLRDAMPVLFELLKTEQDASARIVLGHFIFVYIHPYMDGNGRTGHFLMNLMMASGGYPWTVIPVERCDEYMEALEAAGVGGNIIPFTEFIASLSKR